MYAIRSYYGSRRSHRFCPPQSLRGHNVSILNQNGVKISKIAELSDEQIRITSYNVCYTKLLRDNLRNRLDHLDDDFRQVRNQSNKQLNARKDDFINVPA